MDGWKQWMHSDGKGKRKDKQMVRKDIFQMSHFPDVLQMFKIRPVIS